MSPKMREKFPRLHNFSVSTFPDAVVWDLRTVGIDDNGLRANIPPANPAASNFAHVTDLNLNNCRSITLAGLQVVGKLVGLGSLKSLHLRRVLDAAFSVTEIPPNIHQDLFCDGENDLRLLDLSKNDVLRNEFLVGALFRLP